MKNPITYLLIILVTASALTIAEARTIKQNVYPVCELSQIDGFCITPQNTVR